MLPLYKNDLVLLKRDLKGLMALARNLLSRIRNDNFHKCPRAKSMFNKIMQQKLTVERERQTKSKTIN